MAKKVKAFKYPKKGVLGITPYKRKKVKAPKMKKGRWKI